MSHSASYLEFFITCSYRKASSFSILHHQAQSEEHIMAQAQPISSTQLSTARSPEAMMSKKTVRTVARIFNHGHQTLATPPLIDPINSVFETNELLHQILSDIPAEYRYPSRRVSKSWNSVLLSIGCGLNPTALYSGSLANFSPIYVTAKGIRVNPILEDARVPFFFWDKGRRLGWPQYITFAGDYRTPQGCVALSQHLDEFITWPPITMLSLVGNASDRHPEASVVLRVKGGIRVGNLLEVLRKLDVYFIRAECGDWEPNYDLVWKPFGCFTQTKMGYRGDGYIGTSRFEFYLPG
jgi:hypothetical protein